jgi:hypothetical protein
VEGGESRGEADGKTLREEEGGGKDPRPRSPNAFSLCCLFLGFGMGDFGNYKNTQ